MGMIYLELGYCAGMIVFYQENFYGKIDASSTIAVQ
jgi:hypothetical protein